ncbi:FTR1 family iron permease [Marinobacter xestospongiae]|uniref:FTR1 family protein n=1 Tax=Marinobacter xestospongiae TaxID=994319 RepID=A0ABU3VZ46_9GAMM|nr:FTR1 family protein [Marinobacter xestospongiae]MDV2079567.1 FTR1 family protein [Marinobacter xestospongiae]
MFEQVFFIVWRESVEAILVIGIVHAWLARTSGGAGQRYLWLGVAVGVALAGLMGIGLMQADGWLQGERQAIFQAAMVLVASALIVQMVFWMRRHGAGLRAGIEQRLSHATDNSRHWGITVLVAIAVAREGSETLIFLYGMGLAQDSPAALTSFTLAALGGLTVALLTFALLQVGTRLFSWRLFFRLTEILLLMLAASLLVAGVERLIGLGLLPAGPDPLWDSRWLLDDGQGVGALLADFAGYRAWPALTMVLAYGLFWLTVAAGLRWQRRRPTASLSTEAAA